MNNKEKFLSLVSDKETPTAKKSRERIKNRAMLRESQRIAIKVLKKLDVLGWSQKLLAEKLGVSPQQVNKIVSGKENLTIETQIRLQEALDIPILASYYERGHDNQKIVAAGKYQENIEPTAFRDYSSYTSASPVIRVTHVYSEEEQFAVFEDAYLPDNRTNVITNLQFRIDGDNRLIGVFPGFEFTQEEKVFLKIEVSCHFKIRDESWNSFLAENQLRVPRDFMAHLAMITVGTARGVLFAKTEGSSFSRFILPAINVKEMIPEDVVIQL